MTRVLYTVLVLAAVAGLYLLMLKGWRGRLRRQGDLPPPPPAPEDSGYVLLGALPGLYVGTVFAGDWLDRVAVHGLGLRAAGWVVVKTDGVLLERLGADDLFLPFDRIIGVAQGEALAGKVLGSDGMLQIDWTLGNRVLTTGFRADDHGQNRRLVASVEAQLRLRVPE